MMKIKFSYLFALVSLVMLHVSNSQFYSYQNYLKCGIENPKDADDCLNHSLNTGFRCCYIYEIPESPSKRCGLVAESQIVPVESLNSQGPPYFECGEPVVDSGDYFLKGSFALIMMIFLIWKQDN